MRNPTPQCDPNLAVRTPTLPCEPNMALMTLESRPHDADPDPAVQCLRQQNWKFLSKTAERMEMQFSARACDRHWVPRPHPPQTCAHTCAHICKCKYVHTYLPYCQFVGVGIEPTALYILDMRCNADLHHQPLKEVFTV